MKTQEHSVERLIASSDTPGRVAALTTLLTDPGFDRPTKLARLQGWRGRELDMASNAGIAQRVGPAACGALALTVAATGSTVLLAITLATAMHGTFAANHLVENAYNWAAGRVGRSQLPANRAAKRLGCAVGSLFLASAWVATGLGFTTLATVLLVSLGTLALFVAASGICVPSMLFTLLFGVHAGTRPQLLVSARV